METKEGKQTTATKDLEIKDMEKNGKEGNMKEPSLETRVYEAAMNRDFVQLEDLLEDHKPEELKPFIPRAIMLYLNATYNDYLEVVKGNLSSVLMWDEVQEFLMAFVRCDSPATLHAVREIDEKKNPEFKEQMEEELDAAVQEIEEDEDPEYQLLRRLQAAALHQQIQKQHDLYL